MQPNGSYLLTANPLGFSSDSPGVFNSSRFPGGFSRGAFNSSRFPGGFSRGAFNSSTLPGTFNSRRFPNGFSRRPRGPFNSNTLPGTFNSSRFPNGFPRRPRGAFNLSTLPPGGFPRRSHFGNRGSFAAGFSPLNRIQVQGGAYRSKTMKQKKKNKKRGSRRQ